MNRADWEEIEERFRDIEGRVKVLETIRAVRAWVDKILLGALAAALIGKLMDWW